MDPAAGPVAEFAARLRDLRQSAGGPSYRTMARAAHYSAATLARAADGSALPTLDVALAYVEACGGDSAAWREQWRHVSTARRGAAGRVTSPMVTPRLKGPVGLPTPRQLPAGTQHFSGREEELERISSQLSTHRDEDSAAVTTVCGGGGMGKTSLVLEWARRHTASFPDGQLYVNLRGFDPGGPPLDPATALQGFLQALGMSQEAIPPDPDAQAALYRSLVAGRRMLVVLDDAADTRQVLPLLPGSGLIPVLVTSRRRLDGLATTHGARRIRLDALPSADARTLLSHRIGPQRVAAEPAAAEEILDRCGGLPLALTIAAARWSARDGFPLADLAAELRDESARLDALEVEGSMVGLRAALECSYRALSEPTAALFALLGSVPYPEISAEAAAALAGQPPQTAGALLRELDDAHLVTQPAPGRYRMHDLVRLYAAERGQVPQGPSAEAARARLAEFYLQSLFRAERQLYPQRAAIAVPDPAADVDPLSFAGTPEALSWLDTEYANLLTLRQEAVARGCHEVVWKMAWALMTYRIRRGRMRDDLASWRDALAAAPHLTGQPEAVYMVHCGYGGACVRVGRHAEGLDHLVRAKVLAEAAGDVFSLAEAHFHLAVAWHYADDGCRSMAHALQALALFRTIGDPVWIGLSLNAAARSAIGLGALEEARAHAQAAYVLARTHGQTDAEAESSVNLGYIAQQTGDPASALEHFEHAVRIHRKRRNVYFEADVLEQLGYAHVHLGQTTAARQAWQLAAESYRGQWRLAEAERVDHLLSDEGRWRSGALPASPTLSGILCFSVVPT
ncbi:ATP-binding protein [Actinacidiphila paucisporea]|uniref:ATP-binding protein n=1 Tax=Actinacidiphila paucisporea TaxID=310782 RepID=UPI00093791A2|nr:tetratricopeptide repeat protein [Actinacidiphila paucisporea]